MQTKALDDRLSEPYGVRAEGWIRLTTCQPNRVQAMEIKTELAGVSAIAGSCRVNVLVEFGDEEISIAVLVPDQVSDEQKKFLALGRAKSLTRKFGNLP